MAGIEGLSDVLLEAIFSCLRIRDLGRSCCVCRRWDKIIHEADEKIWKRHFLQLKSAVQKSRTARECIKGPQFYQRMLRASANSWNPDDISPNMFLSEDGYDVTRRPVAQSSDSARTKLAFTGGQHSWKVKWPALPGSEAVLGKNQAGLLG